MGILDRIERLKREAGSLAVPPSPVIEADEEDEEKDDLSIDGVATHELYGDELPTSTEALDVMADMIFRQGTARGWCHSSVRSADWTSEVITGVSIRSKYGSIRSCPSEHRGLEAFEHALIALNARSALKMRSKAVSVAFKIMM